MGGKAISKSKRLDLDTYKRVTAELIQRISPFFERCEIPRSTPDKTSWGDVDIIVVKKKGVTFDPKIELESAETNRNGNILSFEYQGHQIDLKHSTPENYDWVKFNADFGYVGHILGIIVKRLFAKLSEEGLSCRVESHGFSTEMVLCNDPKEFCEFVGLDYDRHVLGFSSLNSCFEWITSWPYFQKNLLESPSNDERKRQEQKDMVGEFFDYWKTLPDDPAKIEAKSFVPLAIDHFNKRKEFDSTLTKFNFQHRVKTKMNGKVVSKITGLVGQSLGKFVSTFKKSYSEEMIDEMTEKELHGAIESLFKEKKDLFVTTVDSKENPFSTIQ
eukprot:TRINITY_DN7608_c0_g1_i1.p1 TRINITY_DN7608_c0_g1~~TRINITY_DN7608_c0_g1_i1.p1  ORF type:complete len:330 (+),score=82.73 TRINITY_DN7608_c0_g1_i1:96-1085(+)